MAGTLKRTQPYTELLGNMSPAGTAGSAASFWAPSITVVTPFSTGGATANATLFSWINPESGTIVVTDVARILTTGGTGTFDMGVSSNGTGSNDNIFDGGTMDTGTSTPLVSRRGRTGTQGGGTLGVAEWFLLGPGGSGTNNSIVGKTSETASTATGYFSITYFPLGV